MSQLNWMIAELRYIVCEQLSPGAYTALASSDNAMHATFLMSSSVYP